MSRCMLLNNAPPMMEFVPMIPMAEHGPGLGMSNCPHTQAINAGCGV